MPASEARVAANRINALRSTGPRTPEGKAISRANGYKHGMAGEGVVLPPSESAEVARRSAAMLEEMAPATEMGRFLVDRLAELTVRVQRCARAERAAVEHRAAHAADRFDGDRLVEVDHAMGWLHHEPVTHLRKLRSMPEGVDRLVEALLGLRADLEHVGPGRWDWQYGERLAHLTGTRYLEVPVSRARALAEAVGGDFRYLLPGDGPGLSDADRRAWARDRVAEMIDAEVAGLRAHREALDIEAIEVDRATAADRSAFDPSKEATLARKYEAAAERAVFRTLRELREVEAEAEAAGAPPAEGGSLGSSRAGGPGGSQPAARPATPAWPTPPAAPLPGPGRGPEGSRPADPAGLGSA